MSPTPVRIRASSLGELFDCPARWEAKHLRGLRTPTSGKAQLGTAVHRGTAAFDRARMIGTTPDMDECAAEASDALRNPRYEVQWDDDFTPRDAEPIAHALVRKYAETLAPSRAFVAVEAESDALVFTDIGIVLTGSVDRVRRDADGRYGICDIKTGKTAVGADGTVETQKHGLQLAVYELLATHACSLPITAPAEILALQTGKTDKAQRAGVGVVRNARDTLLGTDDRPGALVRAADLIHRGAFHGNPSSTLCDEKFCPVYGTCRYRM